MLLSTKQVAPFQTGGLAPFETGATNTLCRVRHEVSAPRTSTTSTTTSTRRRDPRAIEQVAVEKRNLSPLIPLSTRGEGATLGHV